MRRSAAGCSPGRPRDADYAILRIPGAAQRADTGAVISIRLRRERPGPRPGNRPDRSKGTAMLKRIIAALLAALALAGTASVSAGTDEDPNSTEARNRVLNGYNH